MQNHQLSELERELESVKEACASRQAELEHVIDLLLTACIAQAEARALIDIKAACGALAQALELSLKVTPKVDNLRHLSVTAA
jgi:hypothetical protein